MPTLVNAQTLKDAPHPGQQLVETHCTICHNLDYVAMQPRLTQKQTLSLWTDTVRKMVQSYGAKIPDQHTEKAIINYLVSQSETFSVPHHGVAEEDADILRTQTNFAPR